MEILSAFELVRSKFWIHSLPSSTTTHSSSSALKSLSMVVQRAVVGFTSFFSKKLRVKESERRSCDSLAEHQRPCGNDHDPRSLESFSNHSVDDFLFNFAFADEGSWKAKAFHASTALNRSRLQSGVGDLNIFELVLQQAADDKVEWVTTTVEMLPKGFFYLFATLRSLWWSFGKDFDGNFVRMRDFHFAPLILKSSMEISLLAPLLKLSGIIDESFFCWHRL